MGKIWIGLPAFNEEKALGSLIPRFNSSLSGKDFAVVVYCDGCTDRTADVVNSFKSQMDIEAIVCEQNKGLGQGVRSLIEYVIKNGKDDDFLVIMDADDTHNPAQIESMIVASNEKNADVVITSRYRIGADIQGVPFYRQVLSTGALFIFKFLHPVRNVLDYTCGYRLYKLNALNKLKAQYGDSLIVNNGFPVMAELLLKLNKMNSRFTEIPLQLRYDRRIGLSKMNVSGYSRKLLMLAIRWRLQGVDVQLKSSK